MVNPMHPLVQPNLVIRNNNNNNNNINTQHNSDTRLSTPLCNLPLTASQLGVHKGTRVPDGNRRIVLKVLPQHEGTGRRRCLAVARRSPIPAVLLRVLRRVHRVLHHVQKALYRSRRVPHVRRLRLGKARLPLLRWASRERKQRIRSA